MANLHLARVKMDSAYHKILHVKSKLEVPLQQVVKEIAIFKLASSLVCLTIFICLLSFSTIQDELEGMNETYVHLDSNLRHFVAARVAWERKIVKFFYASYVILAIHFIVTFAFSFVLLVGSIKSNKLLCKAWIASTAVGIALEMLLLIIGFAMSGSTTFGLLLASCVLNSMFLVIVKQFMSEI